MTELDYTALVVPVEGAPRLVRANNNDVTSFQHLVGGGYVEAVRFEGGHVLVDEDGHSKGLPVNVRATAMCARLGLHFGGFLVGQVAFAGDHPSQWDCLGDAPARLIDMLSEEPVAAD